VRDRRRAESALLRVTQAVESTSDAVAMTDRKGMATYHNPAFVKIFGYTLDQINQAGGFAAIFAHQQMGEEIFATIISGENWSGEVRLRTREGQLVDSFLRADAVKDENGQIIGAIAVNTDITPIKQAEAALRETSEQLQCLINAMPDIVCFKDSQGHWKIANQAMIQLFQLEEIDYQGKTNSQLAAEIESYHGRSDYRETLIQCEKTDEIAWSKGTISYSEVMVRSENGSPRSFDVIKVPLFHPDGSRNAIVIIGRDVSDRKQAEAAKMLLASIVESSDDAIIGKNLEGIIQSWNAGAERIYGYTAAEVQGQSIAILSVPDRTAEVPQLLTGIKQGTSLDHYETVHRRKNGEQIYVSLTLSPIKNSQGEITGVSTIARDITDLKRVEDALERIRHQNELILNCAGEGICGLDEQGNTTFINRAAAQMLGYSITELHSKPFSIILNSNSAPIYAALKDGSIHHTSDAVFWRKDGSSFPVDYISTPIEEQGKIVGAVVTFNDISDRLAIERMKNEFISVVSHELRTPLTSIRGAMGLLAGGVLNTDPDKAQKMLDIAVANTDRLVRLINDILDLERIQSGTVTMRKQMFDIADLMSQANDTMRGIAEKAGVTLSVELLSARVWGDSDRIFQVLTNLLSNAIKFSDPGGTVWLSAKITSVPSSSNINRATTEGLPLQQELLISVKDQGRGIPPDKLETIFGRFQQVDSSDSRKKGGTGLGLAICRSILDYHGGRIWAESDLEIGSCFYVALPLFSLLEPGAKHSGDVRAKHSGDA
jgi:two-component system sensor histidine kinase VicK